MRPSDYLRIVRRRWGVLLLAVVIAMTFALLTTPSSFAKATQPRVSYRATTTLISNGAMNARRDYDRLALLMVTGEVPNRVAEAIDVKRFPKIQSNGEITCGSGSDLTARDCRRAGRRVRSAASKVELGYGGYIQVSVAPDVATGSLAITAQVDDADLAAKVANLFSKTLTSYVDEIDNKIYKLQIIKLTNARNNYATLILQIDSQLAAPGLSAAEYDSLDVRREGILQNLANADSAIAKLKQSGPRTSGLTTLEAATKSGATIIVSSAKGSTTESQRLLFGAAIGFIIGLGILLLLEILSTRIRDVPGTEGAARMPVIAEIPVMNLDRSLRFQVTTAADPTSLMAEAYRSFRTSLLAMWQRHPSNNRLGLPGASEPEATRLRVLLVTSPGPAEGKSISVVNLAAAFAETGVSVLIVDADFRRPQVHKYFSGPTTPNLADIAQNGSSADVAAVAQETGIPNIRFIASAPSQMEPGTAIEMAKNAGRLGSEIADLVILDSPPLLLANDAAELSTFCDATVLMVRAGWTRRGGVVAAADLLRRLEATTVGIVLVGAEHGSRAGYYGYYGYYGYGYGYAHPGEVPKMSRLFPWRQPTKGAGTVRPQPDPEQVAVTASNQEPPASTQAFDDTSA